MPTKIKPDADFQAKLSALLKLAEATPADATKDFDLKEQLKPYLPKLRELRKRYLVKTIVRMLKESVGIEIAASTLIRYIARPRLKNQTKEVPAVSPATSTQT